MDLLVSAFGARIRRQHDQIVVEDVRQHTTHRYPARRLERIVIMGSSSISADAVRLALRHKVDISYIGKFGKPEARIVPSVPTGSTKVLHAQLRVALSGQALSYARQFVVAKMNNQLAVAKVMRCEPEVLLSMESALARALAADQVNTLMGAEGFAAERYFSQVWKNVFQGRGRDQRGGDRVNAVLNYAYGILYNDVERALLFAGLDPYIGMLHSERYGKPSLTLDLIEEFRVACADTVVLPMFAAEAFVPRDFVEVPDGKVNISVYGRRKIVRAMLERQTVPANWKGSTKKLSAIISDQALELAWSIQQDESAYEAFIAPMPLYEESLLANGHLVEEP